MRKPNLPLPNLTAAAPPPIGSHDDIYNRLIAQLPSKWFGTNHPILDAVLEGFITIASFVYNAQLVYAELQTRLQTSIEENLDTYADDMFGVGEFTRNPDETDDNYRTRIQANLIPERATRSALSNALFRLTGFYPDLFEAWNVGDTGAYNVPSTLAFNTVGKYGGGGAYNGAYQGWADVFVSAYQGMGNFNGFGQFYGGYNSTGVNARLWYGSQSLRSRISDQDIYDTINRCKLEGTIVWTAIHRV